MEIEILSRSKNKGLVQLLERSAQFFAEKLNVTKCNYKVFICTKRGLKREGHMGLCAKTGDREITVAVDGALPLPNILYTLAHEMVHVKQFCRGQYRSELARNGRYRRYWLGKQVIAKYEDRPWELEAFTREGILVSQLMEHVAQNRKKNKKHS
jgi:hypothetical protein